MYDDHYGLSGRPFQLTPDPKFWFDTATHRKAMAYLGYGLSQGEGFIVITGDPGVGKTTLVGHLMATIDPERLNVVKIVTTQIAAEDLLHLVAGGLGVETAGMTKAALLGTIERTLHAVARGGRRTLLIVDEAQALPVASLEELRMLSNFQAGGYPLLQIFLLGQPEFRLNLQGSKSLEQLRQRVIAMHHLEPMGADEIEPYLIHRLSIVGWRGKPRFGNDAIAAIHRWSGGVPRRVNQLVSRVLLHGAIEQIDCFSGADVLGVVNDLDSDMGVTAPVAIPESAPATAPAMTAQPDPIEYAVQPLPIAPDPPLAPAPRFVMREPEAVVAAPAPAPDATDKRIAELQARLEEQDVALRRVLTLLVDWVEGDGRRPDLGAVRSSAA